MSDMSVKTRQDAKDKLERRMRVERVDPQARVDASGYCPPDELMADVKTGERPISKRQFKKGGKIRGLDAMHHAGRKKRASGGEIARAIVNRDVKEANMERDGEKHIGGMKKGGRTHRLAGGPMPGQQPPPPPINVPTSGIYGNGFGAVKPGTLAQAVGNRGGRMKKAAGGDTEGGADSMQDAMNPASHKRGGRAHRKDGGGNWIAGAIKHPGALHKELKVPEGKKIPEKKLEKAEHSDNPKEAKRARFAETLKGFHKASGGCAVGNSEVTGVRPTGGRLAKKDGGRASKGKMNVNIIIGGKDHGSGMPIVPPSSIPPGAAHPAMPPPMPPPMSPPGGGGMPPPPMGGGMPPGGMPPPMPRAAGGALMPVQPMLKRKDGGRAYPIDAGAGGGEARLEKIRAYGAKPA